MTREALLKDIYNALLGSLGPSQWWPARTPFEVCVGAILTQNTNWKNVERAIANLHGAKALTPQAMDALTPAQLAELIRPSGYYQVKAGRLKHFLTYLRKECDYDLAVLAEREMDDLRPGLLGVKGIGPETADSILLYALDKPSFVVDAYTRRLLSRHALIPQDDPYEDVRSYFMDVLPPDVALYNEYHALIVRTAKQWCLKGQPRCQSCPLEPFLL